MLTLFLTYIFTGLPHINSAKILALLIENTKKSYCECRERLTERSVLAHEIWWLRCWWTVILYFICLMLFVFLWVWNWQCLSHLPILFLHKTDCVFLSWICFNYLCVCICVRVCVCCWLSRNNSHKNENLNNHLPPMSFQTHMNFLSELLFFFTMKIDDDVVFGAKLRRK